MPTEVVERAVTAKRRRGRPTLNREASPLVSRALAGEAGSVRRVGDVIGLRLSHEPRDRKAIGLRGGGAN